jgi:hypothetical protein
VRPQWGGATPHRHSFRQRYHGKGGTLTIAPNMGIIINPGLAWTVTHNQSKKCQVGFTASSERDECGAGGLPQLLAPSVLINAPTIVVPTICTQLKSAYHP